MSDLILLEQRKTERFKTIDLTAIDGDSRLSWKAKGLHTYLISRPPHWKFYYRDLVKRAQDGRDAVRSGLKELQETGYLVIEQTRDSASGQWSSRWIVTQDPLKLPIQAESNRVGLSDSVTVSDLPDTGKPDTVNPQGSNKQSNKDHSSKDQEDSGTNVPEQSSLSSTERELFLAELEKSPPKTRKEYADAICGLARRTPWYDYLEQEHGYKLAPLLAKAVHHGLTGDGRWTRTQANRLLQSLIAASEIPRPPSEVDKAGGWFVRRLQAIGESECEEIPPFDFRWTHKAPDGLTWKEKLCPRVVL